MANTVDLNTNSQNLLDVTRKKMSCVSWKPIRRHAASKSSVISRGTTVMSKVINAMLKVVIVTLRELIENLAEPCRHSMMRQPSTVIGCPHFNVDASAVV